MIQINLHNLNFCEIKDLKYLFENLIYKAKQFMLTKKSQKNLPILEDGASGCAICDIKEAIVNCFCLEYDKITSN